MKVAREWAESVMRNMEDTDSGQVMNIMNQVAYIFMGKLRGISHFKDDMNET